MAISRRSVLITAGAVAVAAPLTGCMRRGRGAAATKEAAAPRPQKEPDATLVIGSIGVSSGLRSTFEKQISLALGEARTDVAIGGGVFGHEVTLLPRITVDSPSADLKPAIAQLAEKGATAVIVSCGDDSLLGAMDAFVEAGIAVISVNSTGRQLRADQVHSAGMLLRLCPTDAIIAKSFAESAAKGGQGLTPGLVAYIGRDTTEGHSLAEELRLRIEPAGGRVFAQHFPEGAPDLGGAIDAIVAQPPSLLVVDAGDETGQIIGAMVSRTLGTDGRPTVDIPVRTTFYNTRSWAADVPGEAMQHVTGCRAGIPAPDRLQNTMLNVDTSLVQAGYDFSGITYDAVVLVALAAQAARSIEGSQIAAALPGLLADGDEIGDYGSGLQLIREGASIQYKGLGGPLKLGKNGDPASAELTTVSFDQAGNIQSESDTTVSLA